MKFPSLAVKGGAIGTFCVTATANVSYSLLNMYQHAYMCIYPYAWKIPFLLFSDVIQLDILRCVNKTLYNQFFCMDTFYQRITFTYFVPHGEIHWWTGSNEMTGLNILDSDTFVCGRLWNNTSQMLMYVLLVLVYNTVRFNTILRTAWQRQWKNSG